MFSILNDVSWCPLWEGKCGGPSLYIPGYFIQTYLILCSLNFYLHDFQNQSFWKTTWRFLQNSTLLYRIQGFFFFFFLACRFCLTASFVCSIFFVALHLWKQQWINDRHHQNTAIFHLSSRTFFSCVQVNDVHLLSLHTEDEGLAFYKLYILAVSFRLANASSCSEVTLPPLGLAYAWHFLTACMYVVR